MLVKIILEKLTFISKKDLSLQVFELVVANKASKIIKYM